MITLTLSAEQYAVLMGWLWEPPDECEHGFAPPPDCPNEKCEDRDQYTLYFAIREQALGAGGADRGADGANERKKPAQ